MIKDGIPTNTVMTGDEPLFVRKGVAWVEARANDEVDDTREAREAAIMAFVGSWEALQLPPPITSKFEAELVGSLSDARERERWARLHLEGR